MNRLRIAAGISVLAIAVLTPWARAQGGAPPSCTPIPQLPITYLGSVSGCTGEGGSSCIPGEAIEFSYGNGTNTCCPASYIWDFQEGPVSTGAVGRATHRFPAVGTYAVKVAVYACPDPVVATKLVTVAAAPAIPALGPAAVILLVGSLAIVAIRRLQ